MRIGRKLAFVFVLLMALGVMLVISFAILFIRNHLYERELERMSAAASRHFVGDPELEIKAAEQKLEAFTEYQFARLAAPQTPQDAAAVRVVQSLFPDAQKTGKVTSYRGDDLLLAFGVNKAGERFVLHYPREAVDDELMPIRWIIYYGMFISVGVIMVVSYLFARYLTRPVVRIKESARKLAQGDYEPLIQEARRKDELGEIARDVNKAAQKLKADNSRLKDAYDKQKQFYADITHEVSNPLHTILTSLEMIELCGDDEERRKKYVEISRNNAARINRLFKDLVMLQRYDADARFIEKKAFDFRMVAHSVFYAYRDRIQEKGLTFEMDDFPAVVSADPNKIEQALENLVSNAMKYTQEGGIELRYRKEADHLLIEVLDTGIGVDAEHIPRLTDRFYRTDKARSRKEGGTGLGLSVVKSILEAHGSELKIDSAPGEGSSFSFTLPLA